MARYSNDDAKQLRELEAELGCIRESSASALDWIAPALKALLCTEKALTVSYEPKADGLMVIAGTAVGISSDIYSYLERWLVESPARWAAYNPVRPERKHRNAVMSRSDLERLEKGPAPVVGGVLSRFGLAREDLLRVVVCDGPSMLGYVSVFQPDVFEKRQRRMFAWLVPALQRRLVRERLMATAASTQLVLEAALAQISAAAFIVGRGGAILETNGVGKLWLERRGLAGRRSLRDSVVLPQGVSQRSFKVTPVASQGVATRYLVVEAASAGSLDTVRSAGITWGLTARELDVLVALAEGLTTRSIAAQLGVSARTVETHLTSMFEKAQVETRAEVIAKAMRAG